MNASSGAETVAALISEAKRRGCIDRFTYSGTRLIFETGSVTYRVRIDRAEDFLRSLVDSDRHDRTFRAR